MARNTQRMKHIFVVKHGSMSVWKRLDPVGPDAKAEDDLQSNGKGLI